MPLKMNRRTMMASMAATASALTLPIAFSGIATAAPANRAQPNLCKNHHDWLSRRLHDDLARTDMDEAWRNTAIKTNTCSGCGVHIGPAEHGLIAR